MSVNAMAPVQMRPPIIVTGPIEGTAIFMNKKEKPQIAPNAINQASWAGRKALFLSI